MDTTQPSQNEQQSGPSEQNAPSQEEMTAAALRQQREYVENYRKEKKMYNPI